MTARFQLHTRQFDSALKSIQMELDRVPQQALDFWIQNTPKRTGNARRQTRARDNEIIANYAYSGVLDSGSSRQAPRGMSAPTAEFVQQRVTQIIQGNQS